jgi:hypothetical protein
LQYRHIGCASGIAKKRKRKKIFLFFYLYLSNPVFERVTNEMSADELRRDVVDWGCGADLVAGWYTRYIEIVTRRLDGESVSDHLLRVKFCTNLGFYRLFEWSSKVSRSSHPNVEVGRHMRISGSEFLQVTVGTYVLLKIDPVSVIDDDSYDSYISVHAQGVARDGGSRYDRDNRIRRVVPTVGGDSQSVCIGQLKGYSVNYHGTDAVEYDGVVAMIWEKYMDIEYEDEDNDYDEDDNHRVLFYDAVIVGSSQVFQYDGWDRLYYPMSRWVRSGDRQLV